MASKASPGSGASLASAKTVNCRTALAARCPRRRHPASRTGPYDVSSARPRGWHAPARVRWADGHETPNAEKPLGRAASQLLMETVGIEPTSAIASEWRLRAYPAL